MRNDFRNLAPRKLRLKTCPSCGSINSDANLKCGVCSSTIDTVPSETIEEAEALASKITTGHQIVVKRETRAKVLAGLSIGLALLAVGLWLLLSGNRPQPIIAETPIGVFVTSTSLPLSNIYGGLLIVAGFLVVGTVTRLFDRVPYWGWGSWAMERRREEEERTVSRKIEK